MGNRDREGPEEEAEGTFSKSDRKQVGIDPDLWEMGNEIVGVIGGSLPDYVSNHMRPIIEAEHPKAAEELARRAALKAKKRGK